MKHGKEYAKRVQKLFNKLRREQGSAFTPTPPDPDPLNQLLLALLGESTTETKARTALNVLNQRMVDMNELRVSPVSDVAEIISDYIPDATRAAAAICRALNSVFDREHTVSLDTLVQKGREAKREAKQYLESLDGVGPYATATVMLNTLDAHAIPVDNLLLQVFKREKLVDPNAGVAEVQAFLERNISATEGPLFVALMKKYGSIHAPRAPRTTKAAKTKTKTQRKPKTGTSKSKAGKATERKTAPRQ